MEHKDQSFQCIFLRKYKQVTILTVNIALTQNHLTDAAHLNIQDILRNVWDQHTAL